MTFLWVLLVVAYVAALVSLGVGTLRNGHVVLFIVGFAFPLLWIVGVLIAPTPRASRAG